MKEILKFLASNKDLVTAWTAIAALFVSLLSIILTSLNLWMQRTHNRKAVLPIGHITVGDYENDIFVRLRNDGVGPLLIESATIFRVEKEQESKSAIIDFMPDLPGDYAWSTFVRDINGRAISSGDQITLISLKGQPGLEDFDASKEIVRRELSKLNVRISYKNIYDEKMPVAFRKLDWFGRS